MSLAPLLELVSSRVGIVRRLAPVDRGVTEPTPPIFYQATLSHFDFRNTKPHERTGVGKGLTKEAAIAAAIGEALERYCASQPNRRLFRRFAWSERPGDTVSPIDCVLYSERQYAKSDFPYRRWREDAEIHWVQARELPEKLDVWVPASLVYLDYPGNNADTYYCAPTSNGMAAGADLDAAILAALYELVERDSFLITWMNRLPVPEVDIPPSSDVAASFIRHYRRFDVQTRVFRLATEMPVYAMMAVLLERSGRGPAALVGLGCHADPRLAVQKALFEAAQTRPGEVARLMDRSIAARLRSYEDVHTLEDHSAFFAPAERLSELAFLLEHGRREGLEELRNLALRSVRENLDRCVNALRNSGCRVIYVDLTTSDLAEKPIRVVRTIATGLQPMHFGYGEERLGGRRLYQLPRILGYTTNDRGESELNRCPHPLP